MTSNTLFTDILPEEQERMQRLFQGKGSSVSKWGNGDGILQHHEEDRTDSLWKGSAVLL